MNDRDPLRLPILRGLIATGDRAPTAAELVDLIDAAGWPPMVMKYAHLVESTLGRLKGDGLVDEAVDAAQYHSRDVAPPIGVRRWLITDAGRDEVEGVGGDRTTSD